MNIFVSPLVRLYQGGSLLKNLLYNLGLFKSRNSPIPVISVGNISFGGSEKTPLAQHILSLLSENGFKPALISRGYKGSWEKSGGIVADHQGIHANWRKAGDEPWLIARNVPGAGVLVGRDRHRSCLRAYQHGYEIAVLDDGFQHRRLKRNLDIVLFNPGGNPFLREPVSSLKRAQIILHKSELSAKEKNLLHDKFPRQNFFEYSVKARGIFSPEGDQPVSRNIFSGKKILAFCGIASPLRFFNLLQQEGLNIVSLIKFPDHHFYPISSLKKINSCFHKNKCQILLTTEKDMVKLRDRPEMKKLPLCYLKIELILEKAFTTTLLSLASQWKT